jgi:type I restriction enzyme, S subunit
MLRLRQRIDLEQVRRRVAECSEIDPGASDKETSGWLRTPLHEVMTLSRDEVRVSTASKYPNIGILSFGRGVFEKSPIDGSQTSATTLHRVTSGQFIATA